MKYTTIFVALISMLISGTVLAEGGSTLERIKENETIRIGYRESEPPMSFLNKDKQPVGYSIDLCRLIVNEIKSHLQNPNIATRYVPVNSVDRFEALQNDSIDILCGATTKTLSRLEQVDFTQMTFITGAALMTLGPVKLKEFTELNGKKVAVTSEPPSTDTVPGKRPWVESYWNRIALALASARSLIATSSKSWSSRSSNARATSLPIRPKPLIATFVAMSLAPVF